MRGQGAVKSEGHPGVTGDRATQLIADALFDCYRGYDDETIARLKMMSQYQREAQATRVVEVLRRAGYKITKTE